MLLEKSVRSLNPSFSKLKNYFPLLISFFSLDDVLFQELTSGTKNRKSEINYLSNVSTKQSSQPVVHFY